MNVTLIELWTMILINVFNATDIPMFVFQDAQHFEHLQPYRVDVRQHVGILPGMQLCLEVRCAGPTLASLHMTVAWLAHTPNLLHHKAYIMQSCRRIAD